MKIIKSLLILFFVLIINAQTQELFVMTWNVENLFDCVDDPNKNDNEFLPSSKKEWTEDRLNTKILNIVRILKEVNNGKGPDIIGIQEVENIDVVKLLLEKTSLFKKYGIVHYESKDQRGIDNAILFNKEKIDSLDSDAIFIRLDGNSLTRDIVYFKAKINNEILHIYVNHWSSRIGGQDKTEKHRIIAATTLKKEIDKITKVDKDAKIIVMGDFNDTPKDASIVKYLGTTNDVSGNLINLTYKLMEEGQGTYKYNNEWNMLDQIIVSKSLFKRNFLENKSSLSILKSKYAIVTKGKKTGAMMPTYDGKKYLGGYSDHFPVFFNIFFDKKK